MSDSGTTVTASAGTTPGSWEFFDPTEGEWEATPKAPLILQIDPATRELDVLFLLAPPQWIVSIVGQLRTLLGLPPNWDSYGAPQIDFHAIAEAMRILGDIMEPSTSAPQLVPGSDGGLLLEWHDRGVDLEVEIEAGSLRSHAFYAIHLDHEEWEGETTRDLGPLTKPIRLLTR